MRIQQDMRHRQTHHIGGEKQITRFSHYNFTLLLYAFFATLKIGNIQLGGNSVAPTLSTGSLAPGLFTRLARSESLHEFPVWPTPLTSACLRHVAYAQHPTSQLSTLSLAQQPMPGTLCPGVYARAFARKPLEGHQV